MKPEQIAILMQLLGMQDVQTPYSMAGVGLQKPEQGLSGLQSPQPEMQASPAPTPDEVPIKEVDVSAGGQAPSPIKKGGSNWTDAATLALANSMPELIKAAYQRPDRPQGRSVGGGKPAFQMSDPFGKRDKFRSLMAQYLR